MLLARSFGARIQPPIARARGVLGGGLLRPWQYQFVTGYYHGPYGVSAPGGFAEEWVPIKGTDAITQGTGAAQAAYANGLLTGNGTSQFMRSAAIAGLARPFTVVAAMRQETWTSGDVLLDCADASGNGPAILQLAAGQGGASPEIAAYNGAFVPVGGNAELAIGAMGIVTYVAAGASSILRVNLGTENSGNSGTTGTPSYLTLFADSAASPSAFGNVSFAGIALCLSALTLAQREQLIRAMAAQYGVTV